MAMSKSRRDKGADHTASFLTAAASIELDACRVRRWKRSGVRAGNERRACDALAASHQMKQRHLLQRRHCSSAAPARTCRPGPEPAPAPARPGTRSRSIWNPADSGQWTVVDFDLKATFIYVKPVAVSRWIFGRSASAGVMLSRLRPVRDDAALARTRA